MSSLSPPVGAASLYDRAAPSYGQCPSPFAAAGRLLGEKAELRAGERVLDVGMGSGAAALPAARVVGPAGLVLGIDVAFRMLHRARADAGRLGLRNLAVGQMAAENLALTTDSVDAVLASFVIFWFTDPSSAFEEVRRVLRPGGRFLSCMTTGSDPHWAWYSDLLRTYDREHACLASSGTGNGLNQNPSALEDALRQAGFAEVRHDYLEVSVTFESLEQWWRSLYTHGARLPLDSMEAPVLAQFRTDALRGAARHLGSGHLVQTHPLVITEASE
jgi:ubiquinone/menaquinone biosynthesis C-methylase UbiE